jgi:hypothetical protein
MKLFYEAIAFFLILAPRLVSPPISEVHQGDLPKIELLWWFMANDVTIWDVNYYLLMFSRVLLCCCCCSSSSSLGDIKVGVLRASHKISDSKPRIC